MNAQSITIGDTRHQVIDGFGTSLNELAEEEWVQALFFDDLGASIVRWDASPRFVSPYSDSFYYAPWFGSAIPFPGPDGNNARTYTGPNDYSRPFGGFEAPIAVMGPDIDANVALFDVESGPPLWAGAMASAAAQRPSAAAELKVLATIFSPAPWLKVASGEAYREGSGVLPRSPTPYPFVWYGNFAGGYLDVSDVPLEVFHDGVEPTSALTQFARSTAAYLRAFQDAHGIAVYAVGIQNELNFEHYFYSCKYPRAEQLAAALKALRAELDAYPDLAPIRIIGPEDLLIDTPYALWQFGGGATLTHKNLRFLHELTSDPAAFAALDFFAVHGSPSELTWSWWSQGWSATPAGTLPAQVDGFTAYGKRAWMTETSGHDNLWPALDAPAEQGALAVAVALHRALTTGEESAWLHWQFADATDAGRFALTDPSEGVAAPKYVAVKHFARFIRPDAVRVGVAVEDADLLASAYVDDARAQLTVVALNLGTEPVEATLTLPRAPEGVWQLASYTSSPTQRWEEGTQAVAPGRRAQITVPAHGVVTVVGTGTGRVDVEQGAYRVKNVRSGLVAEALTLPGGLRALVQRGERPAASQRIVVTGAGDGYYTLCLAPGTPCLSARTGRRDLAFEARDSARRAQHWSFVRSAGSDLHIVHRDTGAALDVLGALRLPGAPLVAAPVGDSESQRWQLTSAL